MSRVFDPDTVVQGRASLPIPQISPQGQHTQSATFQIVLPPWVYMATDPGPLARADDGTYIRGAFGPRFSGHGVGERAIEDLPLARVEKAHPEPATLVSLRRTDATTGRGRTSATSAIGPAEEEGEEQEEQESQCDSCCAKLCMWIWGIPAAASSAAAAA